MALVGGKFLSIFDSRRKNRSETRAANRLGVILDKEISVLASTLRNPALDIFDAYYESRQYVSLPPWDSVDPQAPYVPVRQRQPRHIVNFAKSFAGKVTSKILGQSNFPQFNIEEDPDSEDMVRAIIKASKIRSRLLEPMRRTLNTGSGFVRFSLTAGAFKIEHFNSKNVFPKFLPNGELQEAEIKFVFIDKDDKDDKGTPKKKWFRMVLGELQDILYDNPEFDEKSEPQFKIVSVADHQLGFVQGEWFRTSEERDTPDGPSIIQDILGFIDEINYNLSQSSQAVQYNQDPQLIISGMSQDEISELIRSSQRGWNMGQEGKGAFLETGMEGVKRASEFRIDIKTSIQETARMIFLDPEKVVGHAQSAKALEILHAPLIELIDEIRPCFEQRLQSLVLKLTLTNLIVNERGGQPAVIIPPGFQPSSLNISVNWPPIFQMTMKDLADKVGVAVSASNARLISQETALKFVAKDFGVEDIEAERIKIEAQPVFNPFGGF